MAKPKALTYVKDKEALGAYEGSALAEYLEGQGYKVEGSRGGPSKADLEERAAELDIEGRSSMNKDELAKAIEEAEAA